MCNNISIYYTLDGHVALRLDKSHEATLVLSRIVSVDDVNCLNTTSSVFFYSFDQLLRIVFRYLTQTAMTTTITHAQTLRPMITETPPLEGQGGR